MNDIALKVKSAIVGIVGVLTALWGWMGWLVVVWFGLMALDYGTGTVAGTRAEGWSSGRAKTGLWQKGGMIAVVLVAAAADFLIGILLNLLPAGALPFQYTVLVCPLVLCWYIITELGSIMENAIALGSPHPPFLEKILAVMKSSIDKTGDAVAGGSKKEKPPPE